MRIGEFAKMFEMSIDTIRYYSQLGLIIPVKMSNYYDFDDSCIENMKEILELKKLKFSLDEINKILSAKRFLNLAEFDNYKYYLNFFENKIQELKQQELEITKSVGVLKNKINGTDIPSGKKPMPLGIPYHFLEYIYCPTCQKNLTLNNASIQNGYIMGGVFSCDCNYTAIVEDGILIAKNIDKRHNANTNLVKYYDHVYSSTAIKIYHNWEKWMRKRLLSEIVENKLILEVNYQIVPSLVDALNIIEKSDLYILADYSLEVIKRYKKRFEEVGKRFNIVFMASSYNYPIKSNSIDIVIDAMNSNLYMSTHPMYPIEKLKDYLKQNGKWFGMYSYYKNGAQSLNNLKPECRKNWNKTNIRNSFLNNELIEIQTEELGYTNNPGAVAFHESTDNLYYWSFFGQKK